jgi:tetratricopeptide (TPR) repeat protein
MERGAVKRLLYEKAPLFFLSALSSVITFVAQSKGEAVASLQHLPFTDRLGNAVVSYALYLVKTVRPVDLAVYYTHPGRWPAGEILLSLALLVPMTLLVLRRGRRSPYLAVGWFWYLGTLVPVIGLVQVGGQAMADRYTYLPLIGVFMMAVWGFAESIAVVRYRRAVSGVLIGAVTAALLASTQTQIGYWKDSITLFRHALRVTEGNFQAHNNLARALANEKKYPEAEAHYLASIRIYPGYIPPYLNLGLMKMDQGRIEEAKAFFSEALRIKPDDGDALFALGNLYLQEGLWDEAIGRYRGALRQKPSEAALHNNLGLALARKGEADAAIRSYRTAMMLDAEHAGAHNNLAMLLMGEGKNDEAAIHFRAAIANEPDYWNAHVRLAALLNLQGRAAEAAYHLSEARRIRPETAGPGSTTSP